MFRRAALGAAAILLLCTATAAAATKTISITAFAYPANTSIGLGDTVRWQNDHITLHSTTSDEPLSLWTKDIPVGQARKRTFNQAGSYGYHCRIHHFMHGIVHVPMQASDMDPNPGQVVTVTVATVTAPQGFKYLIQRKAPGGSFVAWKVITSQSTTFSSSTPGNWSFRARLVRTADGAKSGFSPVLVLTN